MRTLFLFFVLLCSLFCTLHAQDAALRLVPYPKNVEVQAGQFLDLNVPLQLTVSQKYKDVLAGAAAEELKRIGLPEPKIAVSEDNLQLVLAPQQVGTPAAIPVSSEHPDAYALTVTKNGIVCQGKSETGLYYAVQTLRQLLRANVSGHKLPCLTIADEPSMKYRCFMDDLARGPSPHLKTLCEEIALGSELKHNLFTYYQENQYERKKHPKIFPANGSLMQNELQQAVKFAAEHHVNILGCQQSFSHSGKILAVPEYAHLGESGYILSPTEEAVYPFLDDLYSEIMPYVPFEMFNVCCDETHDLAKKKPETKALAEKIGVGGVYMQHVLKVYDLLKKHNKRMMMWGDIIVKHPDDIKKIPKDTVMLCWWYNEPYTVAQYEAWIKPFSDSGYDFFVCPGQSNWSRMLPEVSQYVPNIEKFVRIGCEQGAMGMLNTGWEDDGESLHGYNWHAIAWGAECSWNGSKTDYKDFNQRLGAVLFGINPSTKGADGESFGRAIDLIGKLQKECGLVGNARFWKRDFLPQGSPQDIEAAAKKIVDLATQALEHLEAVKKNAMVNGGLLDSSILGVQRMKLIGTRILDGLEASERYKTVASWNLTEPQKRRDAVSELEAIEQIIEKNRKAHTSIRDEFIRIWNSESKPFALELVTKKYDALDGWFAALLKKVQEVKTQLNKDNEDVTVPDIGFGAAGIKRRTEPNKKVDGALSPDMPWVHKEAILRIGLTVESRVADVPWVPVELNVSLPEPCQNKAVAAYILSDQKDPLPFPAQLGQAENNNNQLVLLVPPQKGSAAKIHVYFGLETALPLSGAVTTGEEQNGIKWIENDRFKLQLGSEGGHVYHWFVKDASQIDLTDIGENSYHGFSDDRSNRNTKLELRCLNNGPVMVRYGCYAEGHLVKTLTVYAGIPVLEVNLSETVDYYWDFGNAETFAENRKGRFLFSNGKTGSAPKNGKQIGETNVFWGAKSNDAGIVHGLLTPEEVSSFVIGAGGAEGGIGIESSPMRSHFITFGGLKTNLPQDSQTGESLEKGMNTLRETFDLNRQPVVIQYASEKR